MLRYHDEEWGVPSHDDRHLFEMLALEGAQAGLSWTTILNKRENYRRAFDGFDVDIRHFGDIENQRLVYELPVQPPGDLGSDLDSAASDLAINGDVANAHT